MNNPRPISHPQQKIHNELFDVLVNSDTVAVYALAEKLLASGSRTTLMAIDDHIYELLCSICECESNIESKVKLSPAYADCDEDDGQYLLDHQDKIPVALRDKVVFVFHNWVCPDSSHRVACIHWAGDRWAQGWFIIMLDFSMTGQEIFLSNYRKTGT